MVRFCNVYLVELPTTNATRRYVKHNDEYVIAEGGLFHVFARSLEEVTREFPEALLIRVTGTGAVIEND
uniref:Uncharacterized protein n=1 Tax=viral metagenome TaxID=1070528 RepID=A0A6M3LLU9_9ZZZZ